MELPLLEGGIYICCPASEEEVRSDLNPIYQIDLIFQLNSQFAIHCEFPYCFKVDTALQKQVLEECFSFSINVFGNVHFQTLFNSISFSQDKWSRVHMQSKSSKLWGGGVEKYQQISWAFQGYVVGFRHLGVWWILLYFCENPQSTTFWRQLNCCQISSKINCRKIYFSIVCSQVSSLISSCQIVL